MPRKTTANTASAPDRSNCGPEYVLSDDERRELEAAEADIAAGRLIDHEDMKRCIRKRAEEIKRTFLPQ